MSTTPEEPAAEANGTGKEDSAERSGQVKPEEQPKQTKTDTSPKSTVDGPDPDGIKDLLKSPLESNWSHFSSKEAMVTDIWQLADIDGEPQLKCSGEPRGFLYTQEKYTDFELSLEWRYPSDMNGNSGVLVFTQQEPRLWPTSMQVQLHQPAAGSIFPSGDATSDNSSEATGLANDVGKWNTCHITCVAGRLSVEINNKKAGEVTGCRPGEGVIALQSEGSETFFRKIRIRRLSAKAEAKPESPDADGSATSAAGVTRVSDSE
ncbi:MAG: DUF1080 domain-containing protein [Planctomycetaceae bacterium]|nr:DUF1080 domain-containing protein [Planctomycetaceae bacterium]